MTAPYIHLSNIKEVSEIVVCIISGIVEKIVVRILIPIKNTTF